ncbi:MAG: ATP-grasp domain-containing protein, partial [Proteobacteria bacterium]|nr:ATP-grasp domain-containing protein [Pseudomonadota bacterium]
PDPDSPAVQMGAVSVIGDRHNAADIEQLADATDVVTIDLEDVNVDALAQIEAAGMTVFPTPATLRNLTNKLKQKQILAAAGLPTAAFRECSGQADADFGQLGWPVVQKAAEGGYDGRGVVILRSPENIDQRLPVAGYIEAFQPNVTEIAVMVARDQRGQCETWSPVEMEFDPNGNLLTYLIAPARIPIKLAEQARELAVKTILAFNGAGVFGVEMFILPDGQLLINEIAPRTHNSGHYTIDACVTSQFLAQYRILSGQPIGDTTQQQPAVMFNLLGAEGYAGKTIVEGLDILLATPGVHPYLYGKQTCFPLRKMGHVTVVADSLEQAMEIADSAKTRIRIRGEKPISEES